MTPLAVLVVVAGALVVGVVVGYVAGSRRPARAPSRRAPTGPTVADLNARVIASSRNGIAVLSRFGDVVAHNPRSAELGVVRDVRPDARARAAAERAVDTGEAVDVDLTPLERTPRGRRLAAVRAEVRPLGDGFAVVDASDESEAARLEATRRDFVANVSHELKTPVGAMALLAEAVVHAADDPIETRRFATRILDEATRLGSLVTELIALSRLQGAEPLPEMATVDVDAVVVEALARSRLAAESADIDIAVDDESGLFVRGDRTLLVTALSNLVENAIAYSSPGSPVSVSRRVCDGMVEIAVTDRGIGIPREHQERVFERFFRVDPARSRATGGTGLGLAIVKHVAANHGGEVKLWSREGTGSTFTLRVPARRAATTVQTDDARVQAGGVL